MQITNFRSRVGLTVVGGVVGLAVAGTVGAEAPRAAGPAAIPQVQMGPSARALLLDANDEREIAMKQPAEVFKRAVDQSAARVQRRALFVKANPEALEAEKARKPLKVGVTGFSWVDQGAVTTIKDQNPYGTCWAFSLTAALESAWYFRHYEQVDLSEQDLINCNCRKCKGSEPQHYTEKYLAGLRTNAENPYKGDGAGLACMSSNCGTCALSNGTPYRAELIVPVDPTYTDAGSRPLDPVPVDAMKQALRDHGPLHAKMHIPKTSTFGTFTGDGVFTETAPLVYDNPATPGDERNNGAHLVNIVGWDDVKQAWLIKNSWGTGWGKNGFAWVKWGSDKLGMGASWVRADAPDYPFTAVWKKGDGDELQAHGWEYKDYRVRYDTIWAQGYRLEALKVKMEDGKPLYSAVWHKGATPEVQVYGQSYADYRKKYDELWKDGWRLHILANYVEGGNAKYTAVWRKRGALPEIQIYGSDYADYRKKYDELWKDGWRLHILSNYVDGGTVKYTAVWRKGAEAEIQIYERSYADYRKKYDELWKDGWRLHILSTPLVGGTAKYTAVWRKLGGSEVQVYGWDYDGFRARDAELRKDGWHLAMVNPL